MYMKSTQPIENHVCIISNSIGDINTFVIYKLEGCDFE